MKVWTMTDVGIVRQGAPNEDACLVTELDTDVVLAAVCDGMGGANAGEVASAMAIEAYEQAFLNGYQKNASDSALEACIVNAVKAANTCVSEAAVKDKDLLGMGTTIVTAYCSSGRAVIGNVGDSRAYHVAEDGLRRVTTDHSLVSEMIRRGEISPLEAQRHPSRNLITRALGVEPTVRCDTFVCPVQEGEFLLLCSDGLHDQVSEPEIYYEIYESGHPEEACANLIRLANARGGRDNITIVLIAF